jgi:hypothetical protein
MNEFPRPEERRLRRVSKDEASWFETAQGRLLTMRNDFDMKMPPKKEGPPKRAFK